MVKQTHSQKCPHLGLKSDPGTALHFPSMGNYCYHVNPPEVVKESHQKQYCLTAEYGQCPIYQSAVARRMPRKYAAGRAAMLGEKKRAPTALIVIGLVVLVLAAFLVPELTGQGSLLNRPGGNLPAIQPTVTTTASATNTAGVFRPLATATKSALRPFCQPPPSWHPHIVTETDTFASLSRTYARPVEELMQANCRTDENDLQAGERIFLPELPTSTPTVTPTVTPTPTRTVRHYVPPLQPTWTGGPYIIITYTSTPTPQPTTTSPPLPPPPTSESPTQPPAPTEAPP